MQIVLNEADLTKLKPSTRADLLAHLFPVKGDGPGESLEGFDWTDVADLSPGQVEELMAGCSEYTVKGLRVIAESGPVTHGSTLISAGIENLRHFQGSVTKRTRTVTGDRHAFLFTWDDWSEQPNGIGSYAVSAATFRSLRIYFGLDT